MPEKDAIKCDSLRQISASGNLPRVTGNGNDRTLPTMLIFLSVLSIAQKDLFFPSVYFISSNYSVRLEILTYSTRASQLGNDQSCGLVGLRLSDHCYVGVCFSKNLSFISDGLGGPTSVIHAECNCWPSIFSSWVVGKQDQG